MNSKSPFEKKIFNLYKYIAVSILALCSFVTVFFVYELYLHFRQPNSDFFDTSLIEFTMTSFSLVFGVPVALWIYSITEDYKNNGKISIARKSEKKILLLVKEELNFCLDRIGEKNGSRDDCSRYPLKSNFWKSICESGSVSFIDDATLLNRITSAYYIIEIVAEGERRALSFLQNHPSERWISDENILPWVRGFYPQLEENIKKALKEISLRISELK